MKIRKGKIKDASLCLEIAKKDKAKHWEKSDFINSAKDNHAVFLVAEDNRKIVGYIVGFIVPTKRTEAMIHETRVDRNERGKDIGTKLVDGLCKEFFKRGVKVIYAEIEPRLLKFYRDSCKFRISGKWLEVAKKRSS